MFNIALCDNDRILLDSLQREIKEYLSTKQLLCEIAAFQDSNVFLADLSENLDKYDLFILDLEMPKVTGVDLVKWIHGKRDNAYIILLSCHKEYVFDAFEWNVFRFIPKDNYRKRLFEALNLVYDKVSRAEGYYVYQSVDGAQKIYYHDILYISKDDKYSVLHTKSLGNLHIRIAMRRFYPQLNSNDFLYSDRSYIVNVNHIVSIRRGDSSIVLSNGEKLLVSRSRILSFSKAISQKWLEEGI